MNRTSRSAKVFTSVAVLLILTLGVVALSSAQDPTQKPLTVSALQGTWTAALSGTSGCGATTLETTFTLDATGNGTQSKATEHTAGCGDINLAGQSAQIQSFNSDGSGFIALGCGTGCGFGFDIQVARSGTLPKFEFTMAPQTVVGNFLAGVAVHK